MKQVVSEEEIHEYRGKLVRDAEAGGYHINPDDSNTMALIEGLVVNKNRYGYPLCPCRLTGGDRYSDLDVICPCDYRDQDLYEYDTCF